MRTLFTVFSGTGNTLKVSKALADKLVSLGDEVKLVKAETKEFTVDTSGFDRLVISYPIHAFNAPLPVKRFIKTLEKATLPTYLVCTSGEPLKLNDAAVVQPRRMLVRRGYEVKGEFFYVMPYNIIFRHSDKMAARMWNAVLGKIDGDANAISNGEIRQKRVGPVKRAVSYVLKIEHLAMPILGRRFKVNEKCVGCGKCVSICSMKNITLTDGKPEFGKECIGCMGCVFSCPEDAVIPSVFKGWKVNGKYSFEGEPASDEEICSYCRKAYLRYFHEAEEKVEK